MFSYIGLVFAIIYRVPQILKIYRTKSADDLSSYSYLTHNGAYVAFILYLVGTGKISDEWVLCFYYFMGIAQNLLIFGMKKYYERRRVISRGGGGVDNCVLGPGEAGIEMTNLGSCVDVWRRLEAPSSDGIYNRRSSYAERRQWFKEHAMTRKAT